MSCSFCCSFAENAVAAGSIGIFAYAVAVGAGADAACVLLTCAVAVGYSAFALIAVATVHGMLLQMVLQMLHALLTCAVRAPCIVDVVDVCCSGSVYC